VNSPSLVITKLIAEAGPEGLERNSLYTKLNDEILVLPRIRDLIRDNLAVMDGDKIKLTSRGKRFIRIFVLYRSLLNAEPGG
jgi:SpoU rRNA methylase family enzyme